MWKGGGLSVVIVQGQELAKIVNEARTTGGGMQIFIKTLTGKTITLEAVTASRSISY